MIEKTTNEGSVQKKVSYHFVSSALPELKLETVSTYRGDNFELIVTGHTLTTCEDPSTHFISKDLKEAMAIARQIKDIRLIEKTIKITVDTIEREIEVAKG